MSNTTTRHSTKEKSEMKWTRGHFISCYDPWGGKYYATEKDKSLWSSCAVQWSSITLFLGRAINRVVRAHVRAHANEWTKYLMCPFHELLSCSALKAHEGFQTLWNRCAHKFLPESLWTTKIWTMYLWYILCHSFFDLSTTCFIA